MSQWAAQFRRDVEPDYNVLIISPQLKNAVDVDFATQLANDKSSGKIQCWDYYKVCKIMEKLIIIDLGNKAHEFIL